MTRVLMAVLLSLLAGLFPGVAPAQAQPRLCPPYCDTIPAAAWPAPGLVPLAAVYRWPDLAPLAVPVRPARWKYEEVCNALPRPADPREYAVGARAAVGNGPGQWQLAVQVVHWRGEAWRGGQLADEAVSLATEVLRSCQLGAPWASPSVTTAAPGRLAAVISVGGPQPSVVRQYLVSQPRSGTVVELAMWASSPPAVEFPVIGDQQVFDMLTAPLCDAYIGSCG